MQGRQALERWAREDPFRRSAQLVTDTDGTAYWRVQLERQKGRPVTFRVKDAFLSMDTAGYAIRIVEMESELPRR